jgi:phosphoglycolate phosphatase
MFVVFDLDGTLIDSIGDLAIAVNRLVAERGGRPLTQAEVAGMVGEGAGLLVSRSFAAAGVSGDAALALPRFLEIYDAVLPGTTAPYPGVPEMLREVALAAPLAVLTNKPAAASWKILEDWDLARHFTEIIGGDGPWPRKPRPEGLLHLVSAAGASPGDTWMVGDSMVDLRTAQAAGTRVCLVRYGFGFAKFDSTALRGGERFVDHPSELATLLGER